VRKLALGIVLLLIAIRAFADYRFMTEFGADSQQSVWLMYLVAKTLFWLVTGIAAIALINTSEMKSRLSIFGCLLLVLWIGALSWSIFVYHDARRALVDASSTESSPERLKALANFAGLQAGYELDNRLAGNPNTPPKVLRRLHGKPYQIGTEITLAKNPNAPDDVLLAIGARKDEWSEHLQKALKENPRYKDLFPEEAAADDAAKPEAEEAKK
jgi:hypothetical protein